MFSAPRGTGDVLPAEQPYWREAIDAAERLCRLFGYARIDTPVFEQADLFERGAGEGSDVVRKEMYVFEDRGGERLALKPEGTASICRAYLQHGMGSLPQPVRLYSLSPAFRYDRPQAGRRRQHTAVRLRGIGDADAAVDAEVIEIALAPLRRPRPAATSSSCSTASATAPAARATWRLARLLPAAPAQPSAATAATATSATRCASSTASRTSCQPVIAGAPSIVDYLCDDCRRHFDDLRRYLDALDIPYELTPHLVRGLDYYTRTVFEIQPRGGGAQSTIGAGGRYDDLIEELGGKPTPATGFATGIERIVLNMKQQKASIRSGATPQVYVAHQGESRRASKRSSWRACCVARACRRSSQPASAA